MLKIVEIDPIKSNHDMIQNVRIQKKTKYTAFRSNEWMTRQFLLLSYYNYRLLYFFFSLVSAARVCGCTSKTDILVYNSSKVIATLK